MFKLLSRSLCVCVCVCACVCVVCCTCNCSVAFVTEEKIVSSWKSNVSFSLKAGARGEIVFRRVLTRVSRRVKKKKKRVKEIRKARGTRSCSRSFRVRFFFHGAQKRDEGPRVDTAYSMYFPNFSYLQPPPLISFTFTDMKRYDKI